MNLDFKQRWTDLSASQKRMVVVGGIIFLAVLVFMASGDESTPTIKETPRADIKRSVLTASNTRDIGIDAVVARVKRIDTENTELKRQLDRQATLLSDLKARRGDSTDVQKEVEILTAKLREFEVHAKQLGWKIEDIEDGYVGPDGSAINAARSATNLPLSRNSGQDTTPPVANPINVEPKLSQDPDYYFKTAPVQPVQNSASGPGSPIAGEPRGTISIKTTDSVPLANAQANIKEKPVYIPAGSILTGVVLNGLDAPAGPNASKNPFPSVIRIQKEAILPNERAADIKECFLTMSGYGSLSAERAYLRSETLSCITQDDRVIEIDTIKGYVVGEDGKAGMRGKVVHRTGSLLASTMMAEFAAAFATALGSAPVPTIATGSNSGKQEYQSFTPQTFQYGASQGVSASLTRLADYYLDLANEIFPVIEINAGRRVDVILTSGVSMEIMK